MIDENIVKSIVITASHGVNANLGSRMQSCKILHSHLRRVNIVVKLHGHENVDEGKC